MSHDLKNLPIVQSGLTDNSVVFGAKEGQSDSAPDPISAGALWLYTLGKVESDQEQLQEALGIQELAEAAESSATSAAAAAESAAAAAASAVEVTGALPRVNRTTLKALDTDQITVAYLTEPGREGMFVFRSGDYSSLVSADTEEAVYIEANDVSSSSGAWVRVFDGAGAPGWWGSLEDASASTLTGKLFLPKGTWNLSARLTLPDSYINVEGTGDETHLIFSGQGNGLYSERTGSVFDDHPHKILKGIRVTGDGGAANGADSPGDGTTIGYELKLGSFTSVRDMVFTGHEIGYLVHSFVNNGYMNHYRNNAIGHKLEDATSYIEIGSYYRFNADAAIEIDGGEGAMWIGGAIEGNPGSAIRIAAENGGRTPTTFNHVYFELNGHAGNGKPAIDNQDPEIGSWMRFNGCKLSFNQQGSWTSGVYKLGKEAIFDGSLLSGPFEVEKVSLIGGTVLGSIVSFNRREAGDRLEPTLLVDWQVSKFDNGAVGNAGYVFQVPVTGKPARKFPYVNRAEASHPYIVSTSGGVTLGEDENSDYGDGSWTTINFTSDAGAFNVNAAFFPTHPAEVSGGLGRYRFDVFLLKVATDTELTFFGTGAGQVLNCSHAFKAGRIYKLVALSARDPSGGSTAVRIFPVGTDAPVVSVLSIYVTEFSDITLASAFMGLVVRGEI